MLIMLPDIVMDLLHTCDLLMWELFHLTQVSFLQGLPSDLPRPLTDCWEPEGGKVRIEMTKKWIMKTKTNHKTKQNVLPSPDRGYLPFLFLHSKNETKINKTSKETKTQRNFIMQM